MSPDVLGRRVERLLSAPGDNHIRASFHQSQAPFSRGPSRGLRQ